MKGFLDYNGIRLLNAPGAIPVYDEVITRNIYRVETIPTNSTVLDVGAFYGEFSLLCLGRGHCGVAYEPSWDNFKILTQNFVLNRRKYTWCADNSAVAGETGTRSFKHNPNHPAGSKLGTSEDLLSVRAFGINDVLREWPKVNAVKLDCEGAESEIIPVMDFTNINWLAMEWHNCDGDFYRDILKAAGFTVEMSCAGGNSGGIIHARK